jgi:MoxR-like ATPase
MLEKLHRCADQIGAVIVGKDLQIRQSLTCLLAGGHLLIEDAPGVGKTTLAHAIAISLGLPFRRLQFTSDLLPSDVIGVSVYDRTTGQFVFHPGPIFTEVLLADEINRASPKTQSALLEAMEESQVSIDGMARPLPQPFFVIATQNPLHQVGTFPLPESQLDRFLMCISLGYPERSAERALLAGRARRDMLRGLQAVARPADLLAAQAAVKQVFVSDTAAGLRAVAACLHAQFGPPCRGPVAARRAGTAGSGARLGLARRPRARDPGRCAECAARGRRPPSARGSARRRPRAARTRTGRAS